MVGTLKLASGPLLLTANITALDSPKTLIPWRQCLIAERSKLLVRLLLLYWHMNTTCRLVQPLDNLADPVSIRALQYRAILPVMIFRTSQVYVRDAPFPLLEYTIHVSPDERKTNLESTPVGSIVIGSTRTQVWYA